MVERDLDSDLKYFALNVLRTLEHPEWSADTLDMIRDEAVNFELCTSECEETGDGFECVERVKQACLSLGIE